jgi:hypothetical protein
MVERTFVCSICKKRLKRWEDCNAWPFAGVCCDGCDRTVVIPERHRLYKELGLRD